MATWAWVGMAAWRTAATQKGLAPTPAPSAQTAQPAGGWRAAWGQDMPASAALARLIARRTEAPARPARRGNRRAVRPRDHSDLPAASLAPCPARSLTLPAGRGAPAAAAGVARSGACA